jgi:hypothetical protein
MSQRAIQTLLAARHGIPQHEATSNVIDALRMIVEQFEYLGAELAGGPQHVAAAIGFVSLRRSRRFSIACGGLYCEGRRHY